MISQTMQMSCEPPLSGKDGQKGTNSGAGVQMEWDPDPDHTDFESDGEENMLVGEVINVLVNLESGQTETWRQADIDGATIEDQPTEIEHKLNNVQLSQVCKWVNNEIIKEAVFKMLRPPPLVQLSKSRQVSLFSICRLCVTTMNIGRRVYMHSKMCLCIEWGTLSIQAR